MASKVTDIPAAPLILGLAGVLPFAGYLAALLTGLGLPPAIAAEGLALYGAIILSFMGGVQWGLAIVARDAQHMPSARWLALSVVPALIGWAALLLLPVKLALIVLAAGFAGLLGYDLRVVARGDAPVWFGRLRKLLTLLVTAILLTAAALAF